MEPIKENQNKINSARIILIGFGILLLIGFYAIFSRGILQTPATNISNYTAPSDENLTMCSCQEICLFVKETEYCINHDCEIYDINIPPCLGDTLVVRKTTRQKIDYIIPPNDYRECYAKCLIQNITPLIP